MDQVFLRLSLKAIEALYGNTIKYKHFRIIVPHLDRYPMPYCWDTAFHVIPLIFYDLELARENINCLLSLSNNEGMIPNAPTEKGDQDLRSQPPIIIYAAWRYYEATRNKEQLLDWFPKLIKYYWWWRGEGDPMKVGLVSPFTGTRVRGHPKTAYWAVCSTGMDNHPVYDFSMGKSVEVNGLHYIPVKDVLLSSALALSARVLTRAAQELGLSDYENTFRQEYESLYEKINEELWDEEEEFYYPITWDGRQIKVKSAQALTTLIAGVTEGERTKSILMHLLSPNEFWGNYGIPSVAFDDEKYMTSQPSWYYSRDPFYWRGPIWAPVVYLTFRGLMDLGYQGKALELAQRWVDLVNTTGVFAEYYYADGRPGATNLDNFGWTAAVTLSVMIESGLFHLNKDLIENLKNKNHMN
jgi:glycogen debranching enzyme